MSAVDGVVVIVVCFGLSVGPLSAFVGAEVEDDGMSLDLKFSWNMGAYSTIVREAVTLATAPLVAVVIFEMMSGKTCVATLVTVVPSQSAVRIGVLDATVETQVLPFRLSQAKPLEVLYSRLN
ncbi:hypothetical protein ESCO_002781 [Escovopsis weberi]|uniref:Uncharacterized protein n=1 Tax=Escovopsis weberi TaxID=150374 RepID=A0A0M8MZV7_ESCWE|nr:hypothetical protein ESCO_002781 [Escovopsis weberi]